MKQLFAVIVVVLSLLAGACAQVGGVATPVRHGPSLPSGATQNSLFILTGVSGGLYRCNANPCTSTLQWVREEPPYVESQITNLVTDLAAKLAIASAGPLATLQSGALPSGFSVPYSQVSGTPPLTCGDFQASGSGSGGVLQASDSPNQQCANFKGVTLTVTEISCLANVDGASTIQFTTGAGVNLLAAPLTLNSMTWVDGTLNGTPTIANKDFLNSTLVPDGTQAQYHCIIVSH